MSTCMWTLPFTTRPTVYVNVWLKVSLSAQQAKLFVRYLHEKPQTRLGGRVQWLNFGTFWNRATTISWCTAAQKDFFPLAYIVKEAVVKRWRQFLSVTTSRFPSLDPWTAHSHASTSQFFTTCGLAAQNGCHVPVQWPTVQSELGQWSWRCMHEFLMNDW